MTDMVVVPKEPTSEMLLAAWDRTERGPGWFPQDADLTMIWSAMIASAPPVGEGMREKALSVLRRHLPMLDSAAIPTKSEVFVVCGPEAAEMRDAILALLSSGEA